MKMKHKQKEENRDRSSILIVAFALITTLAIAAQSWWSIEQDRRITISSEYEHGLVAVRLLDEHATQTIHEGERNLDSVISAIQIAGKTKPISSQLIREVLTKAQPFNRVMKALQFVNPKGEAWVSSIDYPAYQTDADDRTYIPFLLKNRNIKTVTIGRPFQRFYDAELVVPIAKNVFDDDGNFLGIISTDISVSYFSSVYQRVAKDSAAMVSLFTNDGVIIVRFPLIPEQVGKNLSESPTIKALQQRSTEGMFEDTHFLDEAQTKSRLYTFRKITEFPVTAIFARDTENILSAWRERSTNRAVFSTIIIFLLWSLSYFLWRQIRLLQATAKDLRRSEWHLRASETKFTQLFEHSPIPLALIKRDEQRVIEANQKLLSFLDYSREQICGKSLTDIGLWAYREDFDDHFQQLQREIYVNNQEAQVRDRCARSYTCQISSRLIRVGEEDLVILSLVDISRLREIESEIRVLNIQLEEKVRLRTLSLEEANRELEQALKQVKNMQEEMFRTEKMASLGYLVAGISHELNTPIGNSLMVSSTLHDHAIDLMKMIDSGQIKKSILTSTLEQSVKASDILIKNLQRAAQLIHSFKQVSADQSSDQYREFDLKQTIEEIVTTLEPMYKRSSHELCMNLIEGVKMHSYPGALGQILTNTINNALVHGLEGQASGKIMISTSLKDEDTVELRMSDNGKGIKASDLPRVFDPFFTTTLGHGGSGLGLNIAYNLAINVLGGEIKIESEVNQGTTVSLILPRVAHKTEVNPK